MITKQDPSQPLLLSRYRMLLSEPALRALEEGWQGVFHRMILRQLPVSTALPKVMNDLFCESCKNISSALLAVPSKWGMTWKI